MDATATLRQVFGYPGFRPGQAEAVAALEAGKDVQVVLPTGGGKSLCYQVPAIRAARAGRGPTLVVSPLIALMEDQVEALTRRGIPAAALHSGQPWAEQRQRLSDLGGVAMVYASPERLASSRFRSLLARTGLAHVVIDEAHCVSEWGHDFRPEYRKLAVLRQTFDVPIMAVTATATPAVLDDIADSLAQRAPVRIIGDFARSNLSFSVEHVRGDTARAARTLELLTAAGFSRKSSPGRAIVYVATRKKASAVCKTLRAAKLPAAYYHAGRSDSARANVQAAFAAGRTTVLVATSAFGMGVDLPDIRCVVHTQAPGTIESYYQQAGRAGRDGGDASCVLLYSPADQRTFRALTTEKSLPGQRSGNRALLDYIYGSTCRQLAFSTHFGVPQQAACGRCDVCTQADSVTAMVAEARKKSADAASARRQKSAADRSVMLTPEQDAEVLAFVGGLKKPVGKRLVAQGLRGSKARAVLRKKLQDNPRYGALAGVPEASIVLAVERLLRTGKLAPRGKKYPTVWLPNKAVRGPRKVSTTPRAGGLERSLKNLRRRRARKARIKPYQVFPDRTLQAIVAAKPSDLATLGTLWGMGEKRVQRYGEEILKIVSQAE